MIELKGLTKRFGDFTAVDHLNLTIKTGEFFGLLGPNGAGKTTTISMISTVLLPSSGWIFLDGRQLSRATIKKTGGKLAVVTQEYSMRADMNMIEVMQYQGLLYHMKLRLIRKKSEELLRFANLWEYRYRTVRHLSGGMKRKLMVCRALLTNPNILILDEPTAGMDALARRQMWDLLRQLNLREMTIVLTTHYIEEAQFLCQRVALMNRGTLARIGSPEHLIEELGTYSIDVMEAGRTVTLYYRDRQEAINKLSELGAQASMRRTTLEDVFVEQAGRHITSQVV